MTVKQVMLAALAATTLGLATGAVPASAQYGYGGRDYDRRDDYRDDYRSRRFDRRYEDEDDRPRFRRGGGRGGSVCVTARGNCSYPSAPRNTPCSCDIPGFGEKRGAIAN